MPWKIEKRSGEKPWKVVNEDSGEVVGEHETEEKAQAHRRALYKNVDDAQ